MSFDATYDACVLHPAGLRDLLIRLAMTGLYRAHWSDDDLSPTTIAKVIQTQAAALTNPPMSVTDVLDRLARSGLPRSVAALRNQ